MQLNGVTLPLFPPKPTDPSLRPADALLRESTANQSQYSPLTQHEKIVEAMARHGYYPSCIDGDEERGRVTTRAGYQRIKARVAKGLTEAVFVFHSSRLGRDASERLALQRELKKLRVPIYSAQQGEIRADLIGGVYALMDEQFSIDLAFKIKNAMPNAVKNGLYPARTPVGYKRVWPKDQTYARKGRPEMVIDERYAPLVQDIFRKFGREGWTIRMIVRWLNTQVATHPNSDSKKGLWSIARIAAMLRNPIYAGQIVWGKSKAGYYAHYEGPVLRSGEGDVGPARHPALIDDDLWKAVQMHIQRDDERRLPGARRDRTPALLSGTLVCRSCGTSMHLKAGSGPGGRQGAQYVCGARARGLSPCAEPSCIAATGEAAVLREVARLRPGRPWTPGAVDEMTASDPHAAQRAALEAEIAAAERELDAGIGALMLAAQAGPLAERTLERFHKTQQELDRRITALQGQLEALPRTPSLDPITVEEVHRHLAGTDLAGEIARAQADGDVPALRELLAACVQSATIVERVRGARTGRTGWLRAAVQWTPLVDRFLQHGFLLLDPPSEAPPPPLPTAERMRRWRAQKRAERDAARPSDLLTVAEAAAALGLTVAGIRSTFRRGTLTPTYVPERPHRPFIMRDEVEQYRRERLGQRGRKPASTD